MKIIPTFKKSLFALTLLCPMMAQAEMLALVNYQSKPDQTPKREGLAIIDLDFDSENFAKIITDIPLPTDLEAHHVFYNKDVTKAYVASLGSNPLQVIDMTKQPYKLKTIDVPECQVAEDLVFSADKKRWYVTCMGSSNVIMGDAQTDKQIKVISAPKTETSKKFISHPHGIGINDKINRIVIANTLHPTDFSIAEETVTVIKARSGKVLSTHKMSDKPSPSGVAPVEAVFLPKAKPERLYINTAFGNTLWTGVWNTMSQNFSFSQIFDFNLLKQGVPLEIYFSHKLDKMYVTTASPGYLNIFNIKNPAKPILEKAIPTAEGSHHVVFSPDERYAFVQNNFLDLPGMNDGSISVIDLQKGKVKMSINTFKDQGLNPNAIVMMPKWYHDNAH
ncbi:MAG: YncE family protein [Methylococcales bacterium]|nr:YncE family protein [Methylococcales bacterium]